MDRNFRYVEGGIEFEMKKRVPSRKTMNIALSKPVNYNILWFCNENHGKDRL